MSIAMLNSTMRSPPAPALPSMLRDVSVPSGAERARNANAMAREQAVEFEGMFLNSMFSQMFTGIDGEGPFGGSGATGVWRSFLTDEYAKSFARAGGIGIADHVYRALLAQQEVRSAPTQR